MTYIIYNKTQRKYVAYPGLMKSFVRYRNNARIYATEELAQADCCGDEIPVQHTLTEYPWSWPTRTVNG
jgi:hypothetical protein